MTSRRPWHKEGRPTAASQGYGWQWQKLRLVILKRDNYLCQVCLAAGRIKAASEVDHRVPKAAGGSDDPSNLRSICHRCHREVNLEQRGHKPRPQRRYDADGRRIAGE